jgi:hypothetical protein
LSGRGRPLRFFAMVVFAWVGVRVAMLWPQAGSLPAAIQAVLPFARAEPRAPAAVAVQSRAAAPTRPGRADAVAAGLSGAAGR